MLGSLPAIKLNDRVEVCGGEIPYHTELLSIFINVVVKNQASNQNTRRTYVAARMLLERIMTAVWIFIPFLYYLAFLFKCAPS